jgi:hypothetical protein
MADRGRVWIRGGALRKRLRDAGLDVREAAVAGEFYAGPLRVLYSGGAWLWGWRYQREAVRAGCPAETLSVLLPVDSEDKLARAITLGLQYATTAVPPGLPTWR